MRRKALLLLGLFVLAVLAEGCIGEGKEGQGYTVKVVKNGQALKEYTLSDLKKFKMVEFTVDGKVQEGPALEDLLKGFSYQKVTLIGVNGEMELTKNQVKEVILDFTHRGTVKMASKSIPKSEWIKDIYEIKLG
ncbi:hypothetical protein [Thermococcus sp.]|uniref:hypothetical protein n=1 Tax=Thermococcus sp. TaxID=35749 RepID=UPI0026341FAC|nr:hypothetical protein [Thermococcus sp.]